MELHSIIIYTLSIKGGFMDTKKKNVILTAKKLFSTKGFNESSVQDIITECNISKGTFYNYFSSKNEFLIAYLEMARDEEIKRRENLYKLRGRTESDQDIFAKQIIVRLEVKQEFTLRPIYEIAFYSGDPLLKDFIEKRYIEELTWVAQRLVQLYGKKSVPYATDGAILMHGMIQNMLFSLKILLKNNYELISLVKFIVRQMDYIMTHLTKNKDGFLYGKRHSLLVHPKSTVTKTDVLTTLQHFQQSLHSNQNQEALSEHIEFLIEELLKEEPRKHLIASSANMLEEFTYKDSTLEIDLTKICLQLSSYLKMD